MKRSLAFEKKEKNMFTKPEYIQLHVRSHGVSLSGTWTLGVVAIPFVPIFVQPMKARNAGGFRRRPSMVARRHALSAVHGMRGLC